LKRRIEKANSNQLKHSPSSCHCPCCAAAASLNPPPLPGVTRRQFLYGIGAATVGGLALSSLDLGAAEDLGLPRRGPLPRKPITMQPVLTYQVAQRREVTSWRSWGGIQTEADASQEKARIERELAELKKGAEFPLEIRPVQAIKTVEPAANLAKGDHDVMVIYGAGGGLKILETLSVKDKWNLMFLRHDPGPAYLWYEIVHPRFLRKTVDEYGQPGFDVKDVVVDRYAEMLWRLRALSGLKNTLGKKMVCVGGAAGWGHGGQTAPARARELWKMDLVDCDYKDFGPRIGDALKKADLVKTCAVAADRYLGRRGVKLETTRQFVANAFVLNEVFKDVMDEARTDAITVNNCMGTIMGMSKTTACMPLSLLNDDGYLAFCESDFVVIPSGVLLHYISNLPVFLNDPTYPHDNTVTLAHCTAPRKMNGRKLEPVKILTHFESDYGAAPKVEMKLGQVCTNLVPDFASKKWVGFEGTIIANPFHAICRSQIDVKINGDCNALMEEMKGFHWMMSYGDYLRECGYALKKVGVDLLNVSAGKLA
jgi:hypothetical protein